MSTPGLIRLIFVALAAFGIIPGVAVYLVAWVIVSEEKGGERKMRERVIGRVWRFGDNVDTDQIIPAEYLITGDAEKLGKHAFEKMRPGFVSGVEAGDIIVADINFGCGSSREHAPRALMGAGISCVIAKSFARIFYRNSINIGLPVIECPVEAADGDVLEVDFGSGEIINQNSGKKYVFPAMQPFIMNLVESGGLVPYVQRKLGK